LTVAAPRERDDVRLQSRREAAVFLGNNFGGAAAACIACSEFKGRARRTNRYDPAQGRLVDTFRDLD
jgi:hypothetical protein